MAWRGKRPTSFSLQVKADAEKLIKDIAMDTVQGLMVSSPVMDGVYRASHVAAINRTSNATNQASSTAPKGSIDPQAFSEAARAIIPFKLGNTIHISNSLPYAMALENGHSGQAADGVYRVVFNYICQKYV